jgi:hypothetical protein
MRLQERAQKHQEEDEKRMKAKRRMLGNIRFIGELYKKKMLKENIMHECIRKLLGYEEVRTRLDQQVHDDKGMVITLGQ